MSQEGSRTRPVYRKMEEETTSKKFMVIVDEGWRTWILCSGMYAPVADQLIERLRAYPQKWDY